MDILTATGTRFFISEAVEETLNGFRSVNDWVEVGLVESISEFGEEAEDIGVLTVGSNRVEHRKGLSDSVGLNIVVAHDQFDVGQDALDLAEESSDQFAFKVQLPGDINTIFYFHALVDSSIWGTETNDSVLRKNYLCKLNSQIFNDDTEIINAVTLGGRGNFSVYVRQKSLVRASLPGAGLLSVYVRQKSLAAVRFVGAGGLSAHAVIQGAGEIILAEATLAGSGQLSAYVRQKSIVEARFAGAGGFTVYAQQKIPVEARFAGAGAFSVDVNLRGRTEARFAGAGGYSAHASIGNIILAEVTVTGSGQLSVYVRQKSLAAASFAGAGNQSVYVRQRGRIEARFAGAGGFSVDATIVVKFLLLRDGTSKVLLRDGTSKIKLGH